MHPRTFWKHFSLVLKKVGLKSFKCHIMHSGLWGDEKYGLHKKQRYLFTIFRRVYVCINWSTILIQCFWRNYSRKNIANPKTKGPSLKVLGNFFANLSGVFFTSFDLLLLFFVLYDILRKNCDFRRLWRGIVSSRSEK